MTGPTFIVTGTGTGIGKTVFAAALTAALNASYWKPVQAGLDGETDSQTVARLGAIPPARILPEAYRLRTPASPHYAAARDHITIEPARLTPPEPSGPLVIEGAGGLMVPLTPDTLTIDLFARWHRPIILCARTSLGTINHTLLSIEALQRRSMPLHGIVFIGDPAEDTQTTIAHISGARSLGRLPLLDPLTPHTLAAAFAQAFRLQDFVP